MSDQSPKFRRHRRRPHHHLRHHLARRRAVARLLDEFAGKTASRRSAGRPRRGRDRGRFPDRLHRRFRQCCRHCGRDIRGPVICGLARSGAADITRAAEAVRQAERPRIHTFISTSALHMKYKLRMEPEAVLAAVTASVTLARNFVPDVEWSAEDGSRTDPDFLARCVEAAIAAGRHHDQHPGHGRLRAA